MESAGVRNTKSRQLSGVLQHCPAPSSPPSAHTLRQNKGLHSCHRCSLSSSVTSGWGLCESPYNRKSPQTLLCVVRTEEMRVGGTTSAL